MWGEKIDNSMVQEVSKKIVIFALIENGDGQKYLKTSPICAGITKTTCTNKPNKKR